jgi:hypothetical protein
MLGALSGGSERAAATKLTVEAGIAADTAGERTGEEDSDAVAGEAPATAGAVAGAEEPGVVHKKDG